LRDTQSTTRVTPALSIYDFATNFIE